MKNWKKNFKRIGAVKILMFSALVHAENSITVQGVVHDAGGLVVREMILPTKVKVAFYHSTFCSNSIHDGSALLGCAPEGGTGRVIFKPSKTYPGLFSVNVVPDQLTQWSMASSPSNWFVKVRGVFIPGNEEQEILIPLESVPFAKVAELAAQVPATRTTGNALIAAINATTDDDPGIQANRCAMSEGENKLRAHGNGTHITARTITSTGTLSGSTLSASSGGTALAPAFTFGSDSASGIYQPTSGQVAISAGGVQSLTVSSSGATLAANQNLSMASGTGQFSQTYSGTGPAAAVTDTASAAGDMLDITSTSTAAANNDSGIKVNISGGNGTATITRYGIQSNVTSTGTTSTNVGGYFSASGATNNYGLLVNSGNVGIGTTAPATPLTIAAAFGSLGIDLQDSSYLVSRLKFYVDSGQNSNVSSYYDLSLIPQYGNLVFKPNAVERMRITNAGNTGIGTSSPNEKLEISGNERVGSAPATLTTMNASALATDTSITVVSTTGYPSSGTLLINGEAATYTGVTSTTFTGLTRGALGTTASALSSGQTVSNLLLTVQSTSTKPRMVLTGGGNIGIGNTNPASPLTISGSGQSIVDGQSSSYNGHVRIESGGNGAYYNTASAVLSLSDYTDGNHWRQYVNNSGKFFLETPAGSPSIVVDQSNNLMSIGNSTTPGYARLWVTGLDTANNPTFQTSGSNGVVNFVVNGNGNVGIGNSSPSSSYRLDVTGDINSSTALRVAGTSVCTSAGCTAVSDRRLKRDITSLENSLTKILQLQPVRYVWKDSEKYGDGDQLGFIAQEVEEIFPQVISTDQSNGIKSVAYDHLVAPVVGAIQSVYKMVLKHEDEFKFQEARMAALEKENQDLKAWACSQPQAPAFCSRQQD